MEENLRGESNLSELLGKLVELGLPTREINRSFTFEPSIIPYFESVLRDCGLTPKQIEQVFNAARAEGVGLELDKLAAERSFSTRAPVSFPISIGWNLRLLPATMI